jgi:hypothetical protein
MPGLEQSLFAVERATETGKLEGIGVDAFSGMVVIGPV